MVGAASARVPHKRSYFSNYGSRVDVYGWGMQLILQMLNQVNLQQIYILLAFSGTSSASPIIAGAAASIQGIAKIIRKSIYTKPA